MRMVDGGGLLVTQTAKLFVDEGRCRAVAHRTQRVLDHSPRCLSFFRFFVLIVVAPFVCIL